MTEDMKTIAKVILARAEPYSERQIAEAESYASAYCDPRDFATQSVRNSVWIGVRAGYLQKCTDLSGVLASAKELARAYLALLEEKESWAQLIEQFSSKHITPEQIRFLREKARAIE